MKRTKTKSLRPVATRQRRAGRLASGSGTGSTAHQAAGILTEDAFNEIIRCHRIRGDRTIAALREHLVYGANRSDAAAAARIDKSVMTHGLRRISRDRCPTCDQEVPHV